jgi:hypothetical protein
MLAKGRSNAGPNFKTLEDVQLCRSYVFVSTDASVGTDQSGADFWGKIASHYLSAMEGYYERNANSLQNRFNNVLQKLVNKFVGCLTKAFNTYHSGWSLEDYTMDAKKLFSLEQKKPFPHEEAYLILKTLPKFEIDMSIMPEQVRKALGFLEDNTVIEEGLVTTPVVKSSSGMQRRPESSGKKIAKRLKFGKDEESVKQRCHLMQELAKSTTLKNSLLIAQHEQQEARIRLMSDQLAMKLFSSMPDTAEAQEFFTLKRREYLATAKTDPKARQRIQGWEGGDPVPDRAATAADEADEEIQDSQMLGREGIVAIPEGAATGADEATEKIRDSQMLGRDGVEAVRHRQLMAPSEAAESSQAFAYDIGEAFRSRMASVNDAGEESQFY